MSDINELGLPPDEIVGDIDYNAAEPGSFPPQIYPGTYTFVFSLEDDPFSVVERGAQGEAKKKYLEVAHIAKTTVQVEDNEHPGQMVNKEVELRFNRVNFYKHPQMANSSAGDLIRALDLRVSGALTPKAVEGLFREVEDRRSYVAEVGWRAYCKECEIEVNTHARRKRIAAGEQAAWPRGEDKKFIELVECPKCHNKMYGQAQIVNYKLPKVESDNGQQNIPF